MWSLLLSAALAAPLGPTGMETQPLALQVTGSFGVDRFWLRAPACEEGSCVAVRNEVRQGGELEIWPVRYVGVFGGIAHLRETNAAMIFSGTGLAADGGVKVAVPLGDLVGVGAWGGVELRRATNGYEEGDSAYQVSRRVVGEVGADLHFGAASDGLVGWAGVDAAVLSDDETLLLDNSVNLSLVPRLPASVTGGVLVVSSPMGGPWMQRGRLGAGFSASAGYRTGMQFWLSGSY